MLFKDIVGQDELKERLIRGVHEGRISHAQMFLGEPGSGTIPLAIAYAQYLNCQNRGEHDSCGRHDSSDDRGAQPVDDRAG